MSSSKQWSCEIQRDGQCVRQTGRDLLNLSAIVLLVLVRFFEWSLDPIKMFRHLHIKAQATTENIHMPFMLSSGILLVFFWHETSTGVNMSVNAWLGRLLIPAYVVCASFFIFEIIAVSFVWKTNLGIVTNIVKFYFYAAVMALLAILYVVTAIRLIRMYRESMAQAERNAISPSMRSGRKRLQRMNRRLFIGGILFLLEAIVFIVYAIVFNSRTVSVRGQLLFTEKHPSWHRLLYSIRENIANGLGLVAVVSFWITKLGGKFSYSTKTASSDTSETASSTGQRSKSGKSQSSFGTGNAGDLAEANLA